MRTLSPALRATLRIALPPVLAITGLTAAAAPSSAGPAVGSGWLDVFLIPGGFDVCVEGEVPLSMRAAGVWTLTITGERFNPTTGDTEFLTPMPWTTTAWTVDHCEPVFQWGYPYGTFVADFSYTAAGEYVAVHSKGGGVWNPQFGSNTWGVNPTT